MHFLWSVWRLRFTHMDFLFKFYLFAFNFGRPKEREREMERYLLCTDSFPRWEQQQDWAEPHQAHHLRHHLWLPMGCAGRELEPRHSRQDQASPWKLGHMCSRPRLHCYTKDLPPTLFFFNKTFHSTYAPTFWSALAHHRPAFIICTGACTLYILHR